MMKYNEIHTTMVGSRLKRNLTMDIDQFIDLCLLDEYAEGDCYKGYSLDVDSIPEHDRANFLDMLMKDDTAVRDFVLHNMQQLIDARLSEYELKKRQDAGLRLVHCSNGDTRFEKVGGASW